MCLQRFCSCVSTKRDLTFFFPLQAFKCIDFLRDGKWNISGQSVHFGVACFWKCIGSFSLRQQSSFALLKGARQKPFRRDILGSIVVSISACHVEDPGSIPGRGAFFFFFLNLIFFGQFCDDCVMIKIPPLMCSTNTAKDFQYWLCIIITVSSPY